MEFRAARGLGEMQNGERRSRGLQRCAHLRLRRREAAGNRRSTPAAAVRSGQPAASAARAAARRSRAQAQGNGAGARARGGSRPPFIGVRVGALGTHA
jgi:hypothetical protein